MRFIDLHHVGREQVIGSAFVDGVLVDPGPASCLDALLEGLGDEVPRVIALTHIHLDHAGATGVLARRWPDAEIWVHERGARHLVAPEKLVASATRLYGDDMQRLWGEIASVPAERLRIVGEEALPGGWRVMPAPGHASHHVAYLHEGSGDAFCGDVAGVRLPGSPTLAPTPPPDIDLEAWDRSLQRLAEWEPARVVCTHFGAYEDVVDQIDGVRLWLDTWSAPARALSCEDWIAEHAAWLRARVPAEAVAETIEQAMPPEQCWLGLDRYWTRARS